MIDFTVDPVISLTLRGSFALLFALAGIEKFHDRETFQFQLEQYQLIPKQLVPMSASVIIFAEITTAIALLFYNPDAGVVLGCLLLLVYAAAILVNLLRGRTWMDCGCMGSGGEGLSYWLVVRNLVMFCALLSLLLPGTGRAIIWLDYVSLLFAVASFSLGYVIINSLLAANTRSKMWWR